MYSALLLLFFSICLPLVRSAAGPPIRGPAQPSQSFGVAGTNASYDYVVVGGGTAGLVVAARLAENPSNSVAVIEAGGFYEIDNGNLSTIPADDIYYAGASPEDINPLVDWGFVTVPQAGMNHRRLHYARGKCLGGSSARNYFTYQRGTTGSYERWAGEVGDTSYELSAFMPFFQKSANFTPPNNALRPANASVSYNPTAFTPGSGPLQVSIPIFANPFSSFAKIAFEGLGFQQAVDYVSGKLFGVQYNMNTINPQGQVRSSSQASFLAMAMENTTLKVYNETMAKKILFNGNRAVGVLVSTGAKSYTLSARKEVIVSAGVFQSPQILMVSGVGPSETLEQHGIPVVSNLQGVGQNLWDQLLFGASYRVATLTHSALNNATFRAHATSQYLANGSGLLGNPGGDLIAWEKLPGLDRTKLSNATRSALADFPKDWPEIEYLILDAYSGDNENYIQGAPKTPFMYASPAAVLVAPSSRGNVSISSADTADLPVINPNWLTHPADQELAVAAFKRVRQMMATEIMRSVTIGKEIFPGSNVTTDAQILNHIRQTGIEIFHASATCKMGQPGDPMAVVDSRARVFGVTGLRVVDASALPFLPPGHPQATIYALAEKIAADLSARPKRDGEN